MAAVKGMAISGKPCGSVLLLAASTWQKSGGYFFKFSSGYATQCSATDSQVAGWVDIGFDPSDTNVSSGLLTVPATTTEKYRFPYIAAKDIIARIPADSTVVASLGGLARDIVIASSKQSVDVGTATSGYSPLIIIAPNQDDIDEQMVRVYVRPVKYQIA